MIDEWNMKLIKSQNDYNEMFHKLINFTNRRLNQLKIFVIEINEKIDLLIRTQLRRIFNSQNRRVHNFLSRKFTFDWLAFQICSFQRSKTLSIEVFELVNTNTKKKRFRKSNINFFDFTCFESHDKNDYVIVNDKMHYRNVWFFLDSTNIIITIKDFSLIRINFHRCFRNDAQIWYIIELINEQRVDLIRNRDINRWKKKVDKTLSHEWNRCFNFIDRK